jgi:hypothetical protein
LLLHKSRVNSIILISYVSLFPSIAANGVIAKSMFSVIFIFISHVKCTPLILFEPPDLRIR